jgi:DNA-directed RNA polymerase specialized sigma24 family protein
VVVEHLVVLELTEVSASASSRSSTIFSRTEPSELVDNRWQRSFDEAEKLADLPKLLTLSGPLFSNAFVLVYRDGLSQHEAAKVIGISESKLSRVLARIPARSNVVEA